MIPWNPKVKLIISDVDETLADIYQPIDSTLALSLNNLLDSGLSLFLVSGGGLKRVENDIVGAIDPSLRYRLLLSHCNSSEIWGYKKNGKRKEQPYFSLAKKVLTNDQHHVWRETMTEVIRTLQLKTYPAMPISEFKKLAGDDPLSIIYDDRGVQITLEVINGYQLTIKQADKLAIAKESDTYDLRKKIMRVAQTKFEKYGLPIASHPAGVFAINFTLGEVNKGDSISFLLKNKHLLSNIGLRPEALDHPEYLEIWGDKFSTKSGKNDWCLSAQLDPKVRSISFREENPGEFLPGYNVVIWNGKKHLHWGLLEYLQSR